MGKKNLPGTNKFGKLSVDSRDILLIFNLPKCKRVETPQGQQYSASACQSHSEVTTCSSRPKITSFDREGSIVHSNGFTDSCPKESLIVQLLHIVCFSGRMTRVRMLGSHGD